MKIALVNIAGLLILFVAIIACNDNSSANNNYPIGVLPKDSIAVDSTGIATAVQQADDDYTKRNINPNQQQWRAFQ